jgi:CRISPR-associated exonuclease Cas4
MYSEEDYIQLASIQHYVFCPRQCALIHVDGLWNENVFTTRGKIMHEKVDSEENEIRGAKHIVRSLNIYSSRLGLSGKCDVVEFVDITSKSGSAYPVEYKSGKPKKNISDLAQLCAQALCLEEMLNIQVNEGAIFYGKPRRRLIVDLDRELREETENIIIAVHNIITNRIIPEAKYEKKCDACSLNEFCMPGLSDQSIKKYIKRMYNQYEETS